MRWEDLSANGFAEAVQSTGGVCLLPLSCLERHGPHLPLATDAFIAREICARAAAIESAVIFPDLVLTQILEARHCPGTVAISPDLVVRLLGEICREIARNGLTRIILVNGHGGNSHMLHFFVQSQLASPINYAVYLAKLHLSREDDLAVRAQWESTVDGHAGETETSQMLAIRPELVHLDLLQDEREGLPLGRLGDLQRAGLYTAMWWYGDHPTHYRGSGLLATPEKGVRVLDARARALGNAIRTVKNDNMTTELQSEFFAACARPGN